MERTLKESRALKEAMDEMERDQPKPLASIAWGLIALHEVLDRLVDVCNDGFTSLEDQRRQEDE